MNFKIITLTENQTQICLHRDRDEDGAEIVRISAFLETKSGEEPMVDSVVKFRNAELAKCFVEDYSERSASRFIALSI